MITPLLEATRPRVTAADAVVKTDETLSGVVTAQGGERMGRLTSIQQHLRVAVHGRVGMAGRADQNGDALLAAALASAAMGEVATLHFPAPAPTVDVPTSHPVAQAAGPTQVLDLARSLSARLDGKGRMVEAWAERSVGRVEAGNTRGALVSYDASLVGMGATLAVGDSSSPLTLSLHHSGVAWPSGREVEALVTEFERRLAPPYAEPPGGPATPVRLCLTPRAVRAFLRPLELALIGAEVFEGRSPYAGRQGELVLPEAITLVDDPLLPGRPGSRPADDDGVASRRLPLIERGRFVGWITDLATGSRLNLPSTGHARRLAFAPPRVGYTNLVLAPGDTPASDLLGGDEVVLVEDLPAAPGNVMDGRVAFTTPWAYRVVRGELVGRFPRITLRGNAYQMLDRLAAVGREAVWLGAWCGPALLLDGISIVHH